MWSHFLLTLLILASGVGVTHAAVIENSNLSRESFNIYGEVANGEIKFEIVEQWYNGSEVDKELEWIHPSSKEVNSVELYLNSEGKSVELIADRFDYTAQKVEETKDVTYFTFTSKPFTKLWMSSDLVIPAGESWGLKYSWVQPISSIEDFQSSLAFLGKAPAEKNLKITFVFDQAVKHFIPIGLSQGDLLTEDGKTVWHFEGSGLERPERLQFMWSNKAAAELSYERDEFLYKANFITPVPVKKSGESVLIMIDQSGSMYGNRWSRVQDLVPEILRLLGSDTRVKIGFFDQEWEFLSDEFEANTFEQQKRWSDLTAEITPTGKSDWVGWLSFLKSLDTSERFDRIISIGDYSDLEVPSEDPFWLKFTKPTLFLDFGKNEKIKSWSTSFNGESIELFSSTYEFLELSDFVEAWNYLDSSWSLESTVVEEKAVEIRPVVRRKYNESQVFVTRSLKPADDLFLEPLADFLPSWWGQYQIAHHLRKNINEEEFLADSEAAIKALSYYYGFSLPERFLVDFVSTKQSSKNTVIESFEQEPRWEYLSPMFNGGPLYSAIQFGSKVDSKKKLWVEPFSEAYFELYRDFPTLVSTPFSWGENPQFCTEFRCVEVSAGGQSSFNGAQRLFWDRPFGDHWADLYIEELAGKNILEVSLSEGLNLDENITRGEFMTWVSEYLFESELENYELPEVPVFLDLPTSLIQSKSLSLLKEKGIIEGFAGNLVKSEQVLLRAEAVKILLALTGFEPSVNDFSIGEPLPFKDLVSWEIPWILKAYKESIVEGYPDYTFRPFKVLNRAEAAKILVETLKK